MKLLRNLVMAALAFGTLGTAFSRQNITIERVGVWSLTNTFWFYSAGTFYTLVLNSDGKRAAMGVVMAAYSLGKKVGTDLADENCTSTCTVNNVYTPPN